MVVGGYNALCTETSITLQCTLSGDFLSWNTPEGTLYLVRGIHNNNFDTNVGSYHGQLEELNGTHIRSKLTFNFTVQITINCTDLTSSNSSTIIIEGVAHTFNYPSLLNITG